MQSNYIKINETFYRFIMEVEIRIIHSEIHKLSRNIYIYILIMLFLIMKELETYVKF